MQIMGTGFNWVLAHSQNFVLVLGMRISFKLVGFPQVAKILPTPQLTAVPHLLTKACPPIEFWPQKFQKVYLIFLSILTST